MPRRAGRSHIETTTADAWGWLPLLTLVSACGLLAIALAATAGRAGAAWAGVVLWLGLLLLVAPSAVRLLSRSSSRQERLGLVVLLGLALYLTKLLEYPLSFAFIDEFLHWRTAQDIAATGHLFRANPLLPISPQFPGLELVTTALSTLSGLSIFAASAIVLGAARLVLMLALFLFFEQVSHSPRVAGLGALVYLANPLALLFDAQFAYQSLAMPFAALILYALAVRPALPRRAARGMLLLASLVLVALVLTHHVTSYLLLAFLCCWALLAVVLQRQTGEWVGIGAVALLGLALVGLEAVGGGARVVGYLAPRVIQDFGGLLQIVTGSAVGRQLFRDYAGQTEPIWERLTALAAVALIECSLVLGLAGSWNSGRTTAAAVALGSSAILYPISQALRVAPQGAETAARLTDLLFVLVGFTVAVALNRRPLAGSRRDWRLHAALAAGLVLLLASGIIGAGPSWYRLPGPYLVSAGPRTITTEGIAAAEWTCTVLGPGQTVGTDYMDQLLLGTYGGQMVVTGMGAQLDLAPVFLSPQLGPSELALVRRAQVRYLVVDQRLSTGLPQIGFYYEALEPGALAHTTPVSLAALTKFDHVPDVSRIFDSGNIVIYDAGGLLHAP